MESDEKQPTNALVELPETPAISGSVDIKEMFSMGFPVEQQQAVLTEYEARRKNFRDWLKSQFVEGVHYGFPPGTLPNRKEINGVWHFEMRSRGSVQWIPETQWKQKPSLYKSGAQLVVDLFQLKSSFSPSVDAWKMMGSRAGDLVMECRLTSIKTGKEVGHGIGAASRQYPDKDYDGKTMNSAVKMANKRALVAAVLETFGLSDLYTQDIEDGSPPETDIQNPTKAEGAPSVEPRSGGSDPGPRREPGKVSIDEVRSLYTRWKKSLGDNASDVDPKKLTRDFALWCHDVTGDPIDDVTDPEDWTRDAYTAAVSVLQLGGH